MTLQSIVHRKGFGLKNQIRDDISKNFESQLISYLLTRGNELHFKNLSIYLATRFGFCYGVERAIAYAFETLKKFPGRKIHLFGEIVHNPFVNDQLRGMGIEIIDGLKLENLDFSFIHSDHVVILPAFGVTTSALSRLKNRGCEIVDTTCGSVLSVWNRVQQFAKAGVTTVLHGKFPHEETRAICSQITKFPRGKYLIVKDQNEASLVAGFITGNSTASRLMQYFSKKTSPGFNPDRDLQNIGLANQTTMLGAESFEIARLIKTALLNRFGKSELAIRFQNFDTICTATQDRQDALRQMIQTQDLDIMLILGGFKSSNTGNLVKIASETTTTFHIQDIENLKSSEKIHHKLLHQDKIIISHNWLPEKKARIGITSGASTPDSKVEQLLYRLFELKDIPASAIINLFPDNL